MKQQGDSSIWKSLAVAFGDGLAFGVGVKIAQNSSRRQAVSAAAELPAAPAVPIRAEPAEPIDLQLLSKVLAAMDARLVQSEAQIAADLKAVDARQGEVETRLAGVIEAAVESRIQQYVDGRVREIEARLLQDITAAGDRTAKLLVETIDARLLGRIELLEGEVRRLRAAADGSQKKLQEALEGIGRACRTAIGEAEKKPEPAGESGPTSAVTEESVDAEADDRRFDSLQVINPARAERKVPIPLVSSIAIFLLGVAALGSQARW